MEIRRRRAWICLAAALGCAGAAQSSTPSRPRVRSVDLRLELRSGSAGRPPAAAQPLAVRVALEGRNLLCATPASRVLIQGDRAYSYVSLTGRAERIPVRQARRLVEDLAPIPVPTGSDSAAEMRAKVARFVRRTSKLRRERVGGRLATVYRRTHYEATGRPMPKGESVLIWVAEVEGVPFVVRTKAEGAKRSGPEVVVTGLRVNRPLAASTFQLPAGARVVEGEAGGP